MPKRFLINLVQSEYAEFVRHNYPSIQTNLTSIKILTSSSSFKKILLCFELWLFFTLKSIPKRFCFESKWRSVSTPTPTKRRRRFPWRRYERRERRYSFRFEVHTECGGLIHPTTIPRCVIVKLFEWPKKSQDFWVWCFSKKFCRLDVSKIAQSGHTAPDIPIVTA